MIGMAWRFIKAMARFQWAKQAGYETIAPAGGQAFRNAHCNICPNNEGGQCKRCDCLILAKTMMAQEECPIGLWHRIWIKREKQD